MAYKEGEWFKKNGYNEKGLTYVYFPTDSYEVKNNLKDAGFKFDKVLLWHAPEIPAGYEDKVIEVWFDALGVMTTWFEGFYGPDANTKVRARIKEMQPAKEAVSNWIGEIKDKVTFTGKVIMNKPVSTKYGITNLIKFEDENGNIIQWWTTSSAIEILENGLTFTMTGTIKSLDEWNGDKLTTVTRCKIVK